MTYAIDFPGITTLPVAESTQTFPVGRIYCVGRNYAEHAKEMGHDPDREPPFFFMKPADAIVMSGATIPYPTVTKDLHHEIGHSRGKSAGSRVRLRCRPRHDAP